MTHIVEHFDFNKHCFRLNLMELSPESLRAVQEVSQVADLGFTPSQVLMNAVVTSTEAFVVLTKDTHRLIGLAGVSPRYYGTTVVNSPWLYVSPEFTQMPVFLHRFCSIVLDKWLAESPLWGEAVYCPKTERFLVSLGFTIQYSGKTMYYYKKGGTDVHSPNDTNECRVHADGDKSKE